MEFQRTPGLRIHLSQCLMLCIWKTNPSTTNIQLTKEEIVNSYGQKILRKQTFYLNENELKALTKSSELATHFLALQSEFTNNNNNDEETPPVHAKATTESITQEG